MRNRTYAPVPAWNVAPGDRLSNISYAVETVEVRGGIVHIVAGPHNLAFGIAEPVQVAQ